MANGVGNVPQEIRDVKNGVCQRRMDVNICISREILHVLIRVCRIVRNDIGSILNRLLKVHVAIKRAINVVGTV